MTGSCFRSYGFIGILHAYSLVYITGHILHSYSIVLFELRGGEVEPEISSLFSAILHIIGGKWDVHAGFVQRRHLPPKACACNSSSGLWLEVLVKVEEDGVRKVCG